MNILSAQYALFVLIAAGTFWLVPRRWRAEHLAVASLVFVAALGPLAVLLLLLSVLGAWVAGIAVRDGWRHGRHLAAGSVVLSLVVFFAGKVAATLTVDLNFLNSTVLPTGFAFYTFQTIAYVVDVLRGTIAPEGNIVRLGAYVSFFPHLTAGPVLAPRRVLPQFGDRLGAATGPRLAEGFELILLGLFKKVVLADFAIQLAFVADTGDPVQRVGYYLLLPLAAFFDISGVLDLARGTGMFFGVNLPRSFAQPITRARSVSDYWRRWQIPLMTWFREYVFRPVSERVPDRFSMAAGILATFIAASLWHAVSLEWLAWGLLTASFVLADRLLQNALARRDPTVLARRFWRTVRRLGVFVYLIGTTWAVAQLIDLEGIGASPAVRMRTETSDVVGTVLALTLALVVLDGYEHRRMLREIEMRPTVARGLAWGVALVGIVAFWDAGGFVPFIYEGF